MFYSRSDEKIIEGCQVERHAQISILGCEEWGRGSKNGGREIGYEDTAVVQVRDGLVGTRRVAAEGEMKKFQVLYWSKEILYEQNKDHVTSGVHLLTMIHFQVLLSLQFPFISDRDSNPRTHPCFPGRRVMIDHASQTCTKLQR